MAMSERGRIQYKFMIPARLKEALENAAHQNRRSLSAEIISRLDNSLLQTGLNEEAAAAQLKPPTPQELKRMAEIVVLLERAGLTDAEEDQVDADYEEAKKRPRRRKPAPK